MCVLPGKIALASVYQLEKFKLEISIGKKKKKNEEKKKYI